MATGTTRPTVRFLEFLHGICCLFPKEGMYGITAGPVKYLFVYNPEAVEFVLKSPTFLRKSSDYKYFTPLLKDGLITSSGSKWRLRRKQLSSAFHLKTMAQFLDMFNKQARILVENIDELMKEETSIEIIHLIGLRTFDAILEAAVGTSVDLGEHRIKEAIPCGHRIGQIASKRMFLPWLWSEFMFRRKKDWKILQKCSEIIENLAREIIEKRKCDMKDKLGANSSAVATRENNDENYTGKENLRLLDVMMNLHLKDNSVTFEEMVDELQTLTAAAHDTTAISVGWCLHFLGHYHDIQKKVQKEIDVILGEDIDRTVSIDDVKSLKYLHCAFKETLRLCPAIGIMGRTAEEDTILNGYNITKGTSVIIMSHVLQRNPVYFPNPEQFIPERFSEENSKKIPSFSYIPFSAGPRSCIGQRYGTYSALVFLATVLRHFNVASVEHRDRIQPSFEITTMPENGLLLKFTKRKVLRNFTSQR